VALAREAFTRARRFATPFVDYFYSGKGVEITTIGPAMVRFLLRLCCSALTWNFEVCEDFVNTRHNSKLEMMRVSSNDMGSEINQCHYKLLILSPKTLEYADNAIVNAESVMSHPERMRTRLGRGLQTYTCIMPVEKAVLLLRLLAYLVPHLACPVCRRCRTLNRCRRKPHLSCNMTLGNPR
jgi:hypothetical protein